MPDQKPFWKSFGEVGRAAFKPYADAGKVQTVKNGSEIASGVTVVAAPGHTVGHSMIRISPSGGGDMLLWIDIVHNATLQFPEPERSIAFDLDPPMAIATRKKVMDMAASDRLLVAWHAYCVSGRRPCCEIGHRVRMAADRLESGSINALAA